MELLKYLLIILPLLVTLIPVVLKTTKEDRGVRHFLNLTTSGVWLVAVIAMLTAVSIIYEYFDNENIDNEKAALRQRAKDDSTVAKLRYDSTQLALKSANDSITNLGKINSTLLNNDTVNFATTLDNFRQQLNGQGKTLKELNKLLNPLFPFLLEVNFSISRRNLPDSINQKISDLINLIIYQKKYYGYYFIMPNETNEPMLLSKKHKIGVYPEDATIKELDEIAEKLLPITFEMGIDKDSMGVSFTNTQLHFRLHNSDLDYYYFLSPDGMVVNFITKVTFEEIYESYISSLYECDGSYFYIEYLQPLKEQALDLSGVSIYSGVNFEKFYDFPFLKTNRISYSNSYSGYKKQINIVEAAKKNVKMSIENASGFKP